MSRRYGERGYGRYGDEDERREEREYDAGAREDNYGGRHIRGLGQDDPSRGYSSGREQAQGREYDYGRDFGYGRDYDARDHVSRDYNAREYGRRVHAEGGYAPREYEGDDYAAGRGGNYRPDYGRERERRREHEREHDPDRVQSFDTDYGRTTSRFYGRSGYEYGRDDYDRPNYGPEVTEYRSRRHDESGDRRDARDERDARGRGGRGWWDRAADEVLAWFGDDEAARRRRAEGGRAGERGAGEGRASGLYRGRGPKNYRRPDERTREEIHDRLTDNDWLDASDVDVTVVNGEAVLSGTVDSRYSKRLAEDIAESVTGVSNVQNNLRVQSYQTGAPAAAPRDALTPTSDETVAASDAPTFTDVIKNAVTNASTTPEVEGSTGTDAPPTNTRASRAGGRG
jgi:osmotically-inducible protein OsmY